MQDHGRISGAGSPYPEEQLHRLLKDYNLITICAESFSPWFISQELTPTLYKLTHEGFVFTNYYQPGWGQSTTRGEFAT